MPRDVAMERPHAGVVRLVLQHEVPVRLHELDVAPLGVGLVDDGAVPGAGAFGQHVEVVPVEVHGVGGGEVVVDDEADGGVVAEVVGVPLGVEGVGDVALVGEDEHGVAGRGGELVMGGGEGCFGGEGDGLTRSCRGMIRRSCRRGIRRSRLCGL